jgi:hypothetical protein
MISSDDFTSFSPRATVVVQGDGPASYLNGNDTARPGRNLAASGEITWPSVGRNLAAYGEFSVAADREDHD